MYADDYTIWLSAPTCSELNISLQQELQSVVEWIRKNKLVLNVLKTNSIIFGTTHTLQLQPELNLVINNVPVKQVQETKLLGVVLDKKLLWTKQIDKMVSKMGSAVSVVKRCAAFMSLRLIKLVLQSLVLSVLDYCPVVWSSTSEENIKKLQIVQNRAARIALHCGYRTNIIDMHNFLGWLSVKKRLLYSLLVFFRNILISKKPSILYKNVYFSSDRHKHATRHATRGNFTLPKSKTNTIKRMVMYRAMQEWNKLPENIAQENSKIIFKKLVKEICAQ